MTIFVIIFLILLGLLLLLLEFAVIPGVTVAGIGGFVLLGASVYIAFVNFGNLAGFITLVIVLVLSPLIIYYFFKSKTSKKMMLETKIEGKVKTINEEKLKVGDSGKTIGRLAPMGKVRVNEEIVDAQSDGQFIDHNTEIIIIKVLSNKLVVKPLNFKS